MCTKQKNIVFKILGNHFSCLRGTPVRPSHGDRNWCINCINPEPQSNGPLYGNTMIGTLAVDGWAVTFGQRGGDWVGCVPAQSPPRCRLPNTTHPSRVMGDIKFAVSVCLSVWDVRISSETAKRIWLEFCTETDVCHRHCVSHFGGDRPGFRPREPKMRFS